MGLILWQVRKFDVNPVNGSPIGISVYVGCVWTSQVTGDEHVGDATCLIRNKQIKAKISRDQRLDLREYSQTAALPFSLSLSLFL